MFVLLPWYSITRLCIGYKADRFLMIATRPHVNIGMRCSSGHWPRNCRQKWPMTKSRTPSSLRCDRDPHKERTTGVLSHKRASNFLYDIWRRAILAAAINHHWPIEDVTWWQDILTYVPKGSTSSLINTRVYGRHLTLKCFTDGWLTLFRPLAITSSLDASNIATLPILWYYRHQVLNSRLQSDRYLRANSFSSFGNTTF